MVKENDIITDGTTKWKVRRLGGSSDGNPVGTIIMYAANNMPEGYLLCDGSAVSRTDYADLFAVVGTTWGAGDGSTTFNLPNAVNRFPEGSATAGGYIEAGLPNITIPCSGWSGLESVYSAPGYLASPLGGADGHTVVYRITKNRTVNMDGVMQPSAIVYRQLIKYI